MNDLEQSNIIVDDGKVSINVIRRLEKKHQIRLPNSYVDFITKHNGASIYKGIFNFYDNNRKKESAEGIAFKNVRTITEDMQSRLKQSTSDPNDPDIFKFYHYFDERLIPFGDTGGGDLICFDYRENQKTNNPTIIYWCHDAWSHEGRISFIAKNFEEFINMLYAPKDE